MSRRNLGLAIAAAGAVLVILAVAADAIGLSGTGSDDSFGTRQIIVTVVGAVALVAGLIFAFAPGRSDR